MKILKPITNGEFTKYPDNCGLLEKDTYIFLAGPCPRKDYTDDWRYEAFAILEKLGYTGTVITPTNDQYMIYAEKDPEALRKQTEWETIGLNKADAIVFWVARSEKHPAFTTNIEFGEWFKKEHAYVGWPPEAIKNNYMQIRCDMIGKKVYDNLEDMLTQVVNDLRK